MSEEERGVVAFSKRAVWPLATVKTRLAFVPLPLIGAAIVIYTLITGHKL